MRRVKYMINTSNIDSSVHKTFVYVADKYDEDCVLCNIVTLLMNENDDGYITSRKVFNFKYYFNGSTEFDTLPNSAISTYNNNLIMLIRHLKSCANHFKNGSLSDYAIKDSIINYIMEVFEHDPNFKNSNLITIDKTFDELEQSFKFDSVCIEYPKDLNTKEDPYIYIRFKYPSYDNYGMTYIDKIAITADCFQIDYFDEFGCHVSGYIMDTFIFPVLDILSSKSNNKIDELVEYFTPHLATTALHSRFKSI